MAALPKGAVQAALCALNQVKTSDGQNHSDVTLRSRQAGRHADSWATHTSGIVLLALRWNDPRVALCRYCSAGFICLLSCQQSWYLVAQWPSQGLPVSGIRFGSISAEVFFSWLNARGDATGLNFRDRAGELRLCDQPVKCFRLWCLPKPCVSRDTACHSTSLSGQLGPNRGLSHASASLSVLESVMHPADQEEPHMETASAMSSCTIVSNQKLPNRRQALERIRKRIKGSQSSPEWLHMHKTMPEMCVCIFSAIIFA